MTLRERAEKLFQKLAFGEMVKDGMDAIDLIELELIDVNSEALVRGMTDGERSPDAKSVVMASLGGWQEPALSREVDAVLNGDRFNKCPLETTGFTLNHFRELGTVVIGADNKCICTIKDRCLDVDKRDGMRCTRQHLEQLNCEAGRRRAWQSGDDE